MTQFMSAPTTVRVWFSTGPAWTQNAQGAATGGQGEDGFRYSDWARDLRCLMANAKEGIELADNHGTRLARHQLYVTRLRTHLKKLPEFNGAEEPLTWLAEEIDLLLHHRNSNLLRTVSGARQGTTIADQRLRAIAVLCIKSYLRVGLKPPEARSRVASAIIARGYKGDRGKFGPAELKNWVTKFDSGDQPEALLTVERLLGLPTLAGASTAREVEKVAAQMLDSIRFPILPHSKTAVE